MREYEIVIIAHPDLEEAALTDAVDKVKGWVEESSGSVGKIELWGKRRLAYAIRKQNEGQYVLLKVKLSPNSVAAIERNLRFHEPIMRYLITQM